MFLYCNTIAIFNTKQVGQPLHFYKKVKFIITLLFRVLFLYLLSFFFQLFIDFKNVPMYKVMIVDDMPKHRQQIAVIVQQIPDVEIIACLENGVQVLHWLHNKREMPDAVILDIAMPKLDGVGVMEYIQDFFNHIKVLVISSHAEKHIIKDILAAGALGFLWKHDNYPHLKTGLLKVLNNEVYIDERLTDGSTYNRDALMHQRALEKHIVREDHELTDREWQIVKIIIAQTNYTEIGKALNITQKTVETYVARLNKKLGISGGRFSLHTFSVSRGISKIARLAKL
jgi:DNA-binding NarL/FixJ family response regulator